MCVAARDSSSGGVLLDAVIPRRGAATDGDEGSAAADEGESDEQLRLNIPGGATLIYDVQLTEVRSPNPKSRAAAPEHREL